jgi:phage terminase small subunit
MDLSPKHTRFVAEYLTDLNATRAYRAVYGVSQKVAEASGPGC